MLVEGEQAEACTTDRDAVATAAAPAACAVHRVVAVVGRLTDVAVIAVLVDEVLLEARAARDVGTARISVLVLGGAVVRGRVGVLVGLELAHCVVGVAKCATDIHHLIGLGRAAGEGVGEPTAHVRVVLEDEHIAHLRRVVRAHGSRLGQERLAGVANFLKVRIEIRHTAAGRVHLYVATRVTANAPNVDLVLVQPVDLEVERVESHAVIKIRHVVIHGVATRAVAALVLVELVRGVILTVNVHARALPWASRVHIRITVVVIPHRTKPWHIGEPVVD
mmetsp:Transcript_25667/g.59963  ORF Transcript_25667/g.59963 Transcript_25667/m.59963 type:complete len:278 (+) Transcript_25667:525-1358(+)